MGALAAAVCGRRVKYVSLVVAQLTHGATFVLRRHASVALLESQRVKHIRELQEVRMAAKELSFQG